MERDMVLHQSETLQHYSTSHYVKGLFPPTIEDRNVNDDIFISVKHRSHNIVDQHPDESRNGKIDILYLRAKEIILASGSLPSELELREAGVFTKNSISKGTRYGPFQGKWASVPQDHRFAWEVSHFYFNNTTYFLPFGISRHRNQLLLSFSIQLYF